MPASANINAPTLTRGLVIEAMRKIVSGSMRQAGFDVAQADAGELRDAIMPRHEHDRPGDLTTPHGGLDMRAGALQAGTGESGVRRSRRHR